MSRSRGERAAAAAQAAEAGTARRMVDFFFLGALDLIPIEEKRLEEFFLEGGEENMVADAGGGGAVIDGEGERPERPVRDVGSVSQIELLCEKT